MKSERQCPGRSRMERKAGDRQSSYRLRMEEACCPLARAPSPLVHPFASRTRIVPVIMQVPIRHVVLVAVPCSPGVGLTDFLGGCKLESEHPRGGHHAKRPTHVHEGIQAGGSSARANFWEIASSSGARFGHCRQYTASLV